MRELVFKHIIDDAASEYIEHNAASIENVEAYAEGALDIYLSKSESTQIYLKLQEYLNCPPDGSDDFYHRFQKKFQEATK